MNLLKKEDQKKPQFRDNEKIKVNLEFKNGNIRLKMVPVPNAQKIASQGVSGGASLEQID